MSVDNRRKKTSSGKKTAPSAPAKKKAASPVRTNASGKKRTAALPKTGKPADRRPVSQKHEGMPKSATVLAVERQKRIEQMSPLGQITSELPVLGGRALDGPDRRPWRKVRMPKFRDFDFEWNPREHMRLWVVLGIVLALVITVFVVISRYTVDTVIIEGNVHYSNDEIYKMVIGDSKLGNNSIYLSMKYKNKEIEDIPFIQTMSVNIVDSKTIKITVYEKALAGYIEYLDRYFYFDKDGTVIESTNVKTTGIPQVMGLNFDHVVMYEKLPLENDEIFGQILEITQLLEKYQIEMDKIYFDKNYDMTLYFGDARIKVGNFDYIDEKIIKLKSILPELEGKSGILRLDNYNGGGDIITFEKD